MSTPPRPVLVEDGAILAPVSRPDGGWEMSRVEPGEEDHAYWLAQAQIVPRSFGERVLRIVLWILAGVAAIAFLLFLVAVVIASL